MWEGGGEGGVVKRPIFGERVGGCGRWVVWGVKDEGWRKVKVFLGALAGFVVGEG